MAKKKKAVRSNEERILRVWDIETIKDLMSRRTIYEAQEQHAQELEDLWVQLPEHQATASFGKNWATMWAWRRSGAIMSRSMRHGFVRS